MSDSFWIPGDQFLVWALNVVLQVGLVAALAVLIGLVLRRSSAARYWLLCSALLVVMVCPILTAVVQSSGLSLISVEMMGAMPRIEDVRPNENSIAPRMDESQRTYTPDISVVPPMVPTEINVAPLERHASHASDAVSEAFHAAPAATLTVLHSPTTPGRVLRIVGPPLAAIWATVAVVLLMRLFIQWHRLSLLLRSAELNTDEGFANTFQTACAGLGIRPGRVPALVLSSDVSGPIAAGIRSPKVVLPTGFLRQINSEQLRDILIHEVAHIVRGDQLVVLLQNIVGAAFWMHPLVRLLNRHLAKAREEVCDNYVLAATDAPSYSRTLLTLAQLLSSHRQVPGAVGLFTSRWKLEHRVSGLLDQRRDRTVRTSFAGKLLATAVAAMLTILSTAGTMTLVAIPVNSQAGAQTLPSLSVGILDPDVVRDVVTVLGDNVGRLWGLPLKLIIDADRELIYVPETNGSVSVFNARTLNRTGSLSLHTERCLDLALADGGKKLISISMDGAARLWDISSGSPIQLDELELAPDQSWLKLSASKSGDRIAIRSDTEITLIDVQYNRFAVRFRMSKDTAFVEPHVPYGFTVSPDGKWMVACELLKNSTTVQLGDVRFGYQDAALGLWDLSQRQPERVCELSGKRVENLEFAPDSKRLFATDPAFLNERRIHEWVVRDGELIPDKSTETAPRFGSSIGFQFALGDKLRATVDGNELSVTETKGTLSESRGALEVDGRVRSAAFLGDDIVLIRDNLLQRWNWIDGEYVRHQPPSGHQSYVTGLMFSTESGTLFSASTDALLEWNLNASHESSGTSSASLEWGSSGGIIPWPAENGFVLRQQVGTTQVTEDKFIQYEAVTGIAVTPSREFVSRFTFNFPGEGESESIWCLAMHPTEPMMATGHHGSQIRLWNISADEPVLLSTWDAHSGHVCGIAISPNGKQIASVGWDHQTKLWNITPKEARDGYRPAGTTIGTHADVVRSVAWSQDGQHLASGGEDGQILIWELEDGVPGEPRSMMNSEDGVPVRNFLSPAIVGSLEFTKAGDRLLSADGKGQICIWSVANGARLKKWQFPGWIWQACFSPDESTVATANSDGMVYILRVPTSRKVEFGAPE